MSQPQSLQEVLKATSNIIELKPDKKYLFVFKGVTEQQLHNLNEVIHASGFKGISIGLYKDDELEIIEQP